MTADLIWISYTSSAQTHPNGWQVTVGPRILFDHIMFGFFPVDAQETYKQLRLLSSVCQKDSPYPRSYFPTDG